MSIAYFPAELLKYIAIELSDKDLCSFSLVCRTFYDAVYGDQMVWRGLFLRVYDEPSKSRRNGYDWRETYQARQRLLLRELRDIKFQNGASGKEQEALEVLQELLLDACGHLASDAQTIKGSNFRHIREALLPPSLFISHRYNSASQFIQAISLFLTPLSHPPDVSHVPKIQNIIYSPGIEPSITTDGFPNIRTLEALAQFFIYHIHPLSESLVFHQRTLLQPHELPSFWEGSLAEESSRIPTKWFGAYTYLSHPGIRAMLQLQKVQDLLPDTSDSHLVDMTLFFTPSSSSEHRFTGSGRDFAPFNVLSGKLTSLPSPPGAGAIPGWKRVQFIKDYKAHMWVYEGVMLPGNNMILGHWRHAAEEVYSVLSRQSGPFIFWAVPEMCSLEFRDNRLSLNRVEAA